MGQGLAADPVTPRYHPEVNGFWMCDIGRFQYGWVEGDRRLRKPQVRGRDGIAKVAPGRTP